MRLEEGPQSPLEVGVGGGQRRKISHMEGRRREEEGRGRRSEGARRRREGRRCSVVKHELGKTAATFTLFPVFLQLLLCGGGALRELTHAFTGHTRTHTHTTACFHTIVPGRAPPTPGWWSCCCSSSAASSFLLGCYQGEARPC